MHTPGASAVERNPTPPTTDDEGPAGGRSAPEGFRPVKRSSTLKNGASSNLKNGSIEEMSEEEYEADDADDGGDPVKPKFDEIMAKIKSKSLDLKTDAKREAFLQTYGDVLYKKTAEWKRNLLHTIAYELTNRELVKLVVSGHEYLLEEKDTDGKTPIYVAIMRKRTVTLGHFIAAASDADRIDRILAMTDALKNNCIHAVIQRGIDSAMAIRVISNAKENTLRARDMKGRTPLHYAVEYERCNKAQLDIVRELIARGDAALDEFTNIPDYHSVFEYHEYTRKLAQKTAITPMAPPPPRANTAETKATSDKERVTQTDGAKQQRHEKPLSHDTGNTKGAVAPELGGKFAPDRRGVVFDNIRVDDNAEDARSEADPPKTPAGTAGSLKKKPESSAAKPNEDPVTPATADAIRDEVRLHYLRTTLDLHYLRGVFRLRDHDQAVRFLLGKNTDSIQTYFDFSKPPKSILESDFEASFEHIRFYDVLEYVTFSPVDLLRPAVKENSRFASRLAESRDKLGRGRNEMEFFFRWLRGKRVNRIMKVIVADNKELPHGDEAIEAALKGFNVEVLDWGKIDLSPTVICSSCPDLLEVHLHWGGNNTVLRAWSETEGLPLLRRLKVVHLHLRQGLESEGRVKANLKDFERRMKLGRTDLQILQYENTDGKNERLVPTGQPGVVTNGGSARNLHPHRWLDTMDAFAIQIQNVPVPETRRDDLKEPITVAVIDDGVDLTLPALRGKIFSGTSFDHDGPDENRPVPYYNSQDGHGSIMATSVCRVCPVAKLHIYKLETHTIGEAGTQTTQMTARSAALAIEAAIARKVDIISMSWTIRETAENGNDIKDLSKAVEKAYDANILMFCSASDKGAHPENDYPANDTKRTFRIGAATADGRAWAPAGDIANLDFIVPGHRVQDRSPYGSMNTDLTPRTGSSVATALAAGLGALILHCVRLAAIHADQQARILGKGTATDVTAKEYLGLKKHEVMKAALRNVGTSDEGRHKFIEVWNRFESVADELRAAAGEEKLAVVAKLASGLLPAMNPK